MYPQKNTLVLTSLESSCSRHSSSERFDHLGIPGAVKLITLVSRDNRLGLVGFGCCCCVQLALNTQQTQDNGF